MKTPNEDEEDEEEVALSSKTSVKLISTITHTVCPDAHKSGCKE